MSSARIVMPALIGMLALGQEGRVAHERTEEETTRTARVRRVGRTRRSAPVGELFPLPWLLVVGAPEQPVPAGGSSMAVRK
jgi:hypothetical protein